MNSGLINIKMADEFKPRHSSTVFACDQSNDTRYIRCDFPQCSEHGQAKPSWILNTLKNVLILENHVGKEIHNFMKSQPLQCVFSESAHKTKSEEIICSQKLPTGTKKVLAIFSLKDSQSQLGDWLSHFLDAAFSSEYGNKKKDFVVVTQDFVSRHELMKSIANIEFLKFYSPKVEVTCILSCHSSSQGQVFSCTPTDISKLHGFEEFCSLHDFTLACQDALEDLLSGVHISSCFTLKLDCSHQDWPVDSSWFKSKLKCLITGSIREVYETGSQVCDLYLVLSTMLSLAVQTSMGSCGESLQNAIYTAQTDSFPDLAMEMGLEVLDGNIVESRLLQQGVEDQVSPPMLVDSEVFVALLVEQKAENGDQRSPSLVLSQAIAANLDMRQASDIRCSYMVLPVNIDKISSIKTKASLREKLSELPVNNSKVLFVVLSPSLANPSTGLTDSVRAWSSSRGGNKIYGIHFQEISALQAYYIKNRLKEEVALSKHNKNSVEGMFLEHIAITGLVDSVKNPHMAYPLLLYLIHLAIGENGHRQPRKRLSTGIYSKKPLVAGTSHWTLEEVYMESCHVMSGLARKCSLQVLSLPDTTVTVDTKSQDQDCVPVCSTVDDRVVVLQARPSSSVGLDTPQGMANTSSDDSRTAVQCTTTDEHASSFCRSSQSISGRKRSFDSSDREIHFLNNSKSLNEQNEETIKPCKTTAVRKPDINSFSVNMNTANKSSGAIKVPPFKVSTSANSSSSNSSYSSFALTEDSIEHENKADTIRTDSHSDVIVVDDDSDDCISSNDSNSKGIQADFAPLNPSQVFYDNLRRTGTAVKRLNEEELDTFISFESEKRNKKVKKRKKERILENNKTVEHFPEADNETTTPESPTPVSSSSREESSEEIPLLANVDEVLVTHYVLDLSVDFNQQVMTGSIVLFIEPANEEATKKSFHLCLDSTLVNIESVSEVFLPDDFKVPFFGRISESHGPRCSVQETKNSSGSVTTVIEILDDDDDDDEIQSPDQSDASSSSKSSNKGNIQSENQTGLSLFQRLQNNYGIGIDSSQAPVNQPDRNSPNETGTIPTNADGKTESASLDSCSGPTSLPEFLDLLNGKSSSQQTLSYKGLKYSVYGWCVKVNKEGATGKAWPRCICIKYQTSPDGQSLTWTKDQDGRPCVFSPGAYINNRSLMPCQEPPVAMSTWQAAIHVPKGCMVYMSGCSISPSSKDASTETVTHYYEMDTALPCSTLALAVGWLVYREGSSALVMTTKGSQRHVPCRVIAVPSLIEQASAQLLEHSSRYLVEACKLLGPYPFDRLDLLILPRCFACMGLKSPNLAFLSQSILSSDGSLRLRVAHEVTHAWFGLLIGAKDWTEEWLSEGFATYLEDTVQSRAENWPEEKDQHYREIRQVLRYRTLSAEMQVTDRDMQCLRPKKTQQNLIERAEETTAPPEEDQPAPSTIIKYKCSKKWTQVHYLKGYFLLIHMENMVGREHFERFLHDYVQFYQGSLVTSEDFFGYFMQSFPMLEGAVQDGFMHEWLESSGMPKCLRRKKFATNENVLVNQALSEFEFWRRQDATNKRTKSTHAKNKKELENLTLETSEQIVLMLEKLLQRDKILHSTLRQLNKAYQFASRNAEIRHRWCELIVKHKYTKELQDVKQFLIEDQGMGIYLFGELIISGQAKQRALAEEIFQEIGPEMDRCTFKTVTDMLQGVD